MAKSCWRGGHDDQLQPFGGWNDASCRHTLTSVPEFLCKILAWHQLLTWSGKILARCTWQNPAELVARILTGSGQILYKNLTRSTCLNLGQWMAWSGHNLGRYLTRILPDPSCKESPCHTLKYFVSILQLLAKRRLHKTGWWSGENGCWWWWPLPVWNCVCRTD